MPTVIIGNNTPFQLVFGKKPRVDTLKVFGCVCYVHVPHRVRHKLDEKSIKCIFLGIDLIKNGYKCFHANNEKFYVSKSVKFDEIRNWKTMEFDEEIYLSSSVHRNEEEKKEDSCKEYEKQEEKEEEDGSNINHGASTLELRRSTRIRKPSY